MKTARVYSELAAYAVARGYDKVSAPGVQEWRTRGLLPSARSLGRGRRAPGRLPRALKDRLTQICRYRYNQEIRDLRVVLLLLWLDGADIDLVRVRDALASISGIVERYVRLVGHPAERADPDAAEADLDAAAESAARILQRLPGAARVDVDDLVNAARDALRVSVERGEPEAPEDLGPMAAALGLDRAHSDTIGEVEPWLDDVPADALLSALHNVFGPGPARQIAAASDEDLLAARSSANQLATIVDRYAAIAFAMPPGFAGLGLLESLAGLPERRALLLYLAALVPAGSAELAAGIPKGDLVAWMEAANMGRAWLENHPEHAAEASERGLLAVVQDLGLKAEIDRPMASEPPPNA